MIVVIVGAYSIALAGSAGDPPLPEHKAIIEKCIAEKRKTHEKLDRCIGVVADECLDKNTDPSTYGMVNCSTIEYNVWEDRLNRTYKELISTLDPKPKVRLRDIERAWIAFRDKKCDFYQRDEGGTSVIPLGAYCMMEETGRQAVFLDEVLNDNE